MPRSLSARGDRVALAVIWIGALAIALVALPYKAFDLDRFFVPKELVLHATALLALLPCLAARPRVELTRLDLLLALWLLLGLVSAVLAPDHWLAARALAISISGVALFWVARALRGAGYGRALVVAAVAAVTAGGATALVQAYGFDTEWFSLNRAPGGTFGNRNFVAHLAAITLPVAVLLVLAARRALGVVAALVAVAVLAGVLVLSRSRGAWLAAIVSLGGIAVVGWLLRGRWRDPRLARRVVLSGITLAVAAALAMFLPNRLNWKSDNPYLESAIGVVNYREGSGHGRLVQYRNTMRIALAHPLLGVGPGNWAVVYPRWASRGDPSLDDEDMTANPWPSSDWAAFVAERGLVATAAFLLVWLALAVVALRQLREARSADQVAAALALGGTIVATLVVGAFDAVLLLAAPTLVVWVLIGALASPTRAGVVGRSGRATTALSGAGRHWAPAIAVAVGAIAIVHSLGKAAAMATYTSRPDRVATVERAALLDPGSYRVRVRLAENYLARGSCERVKRHAGAAHALFPNAPRPRQLLAACGVRVRDVAR